MKTNPAHFGRRGISPIDYRSKKSSALVIVLGCLAIISVLIVAFFASVANERQSAKIYANSSSVKLLADSAVSIVMGQIINATIGVDSNGKTLAWASQPGMIRTYNTSGQAAGYYKLYSWANMIGTGSFNPTASTETPPTTWATSPAYYTDLNEPISGVYPIVDPAATNFVQGFSISGAPASTTDAAPMPAQWLYVLQSGQVIAPDPAGSGTTATFALAAVQPSASNPIVARIAFWTDDDTCKVNINTAAGDVWTSSSSPPAAGQPGNPGSFWDIPRYSSNFERTNLGINQPAEFEFQRFPGHPATTYLSAVFTNLTEYQIAQINPRIGAGGSQGGTALATTNVTPNASRLYASVDELLFTTNMVSNNRSTNAPLSAQQIEQAKFFLTAHSRAPEVNLYNQPRIVVWPVNSVNSASTRTAYDNLIAYCGTLSTNNYIYYFQRSDCTSATGDLPAAASTTPVSGLPRNRQLITYLRALTSQPVPGFSTNGESFVSKYLLDRDQILTEIFDYVRALNAQDTSVTGLTSFAATAGNRQGQIVPIIDTDRS
ncbi:MAG TPA: Verru_Chthon cassette protein A, partial [Candidatus Methylacidiphilales bacterium]